MDSVGALEFQKVEKKGIISLSLTNWRAMQETANTKRYKVDISTKYTEYENSFPFLIKCR